MATLLDSAVVWEGGRGNSPLLMIHSNTQRAHSYSHLSVARPMRSTGHACWFVTDGAALEADLVFTQHNLRADILPKASRDHPLSHQATSLLATGDIMRPAVALVVFPFPCVFCLVAVLVWGYVPWIPRWWVKHSAFRYWCWLRLWGSMKFYFWVEV